jgi:transcriptional regulator with GAF, ATPase, and Fis domain
MKSFGEDPALGIVGTSACLQLLLEQVRTVATTSSTVLIEGETGTGKELVARAIHNLSSRSAGPFVKVNCAAIPAGLLESELMGHERGAFTGAVTRRVGRFELAHGGTIFLDEIGELPLELQPRFLRLLQEKEVEPLGGSRTVHCDVRVVAATNRCLREMASTQIFRQDLYYRLSVFPIHVPPLRKRREDIPLLVRHFVDLFGTRMQRDIRSIEPETLARLLQYDWPGNVRELQNVVERAVIVSQEPVLRIALDASLPRVGLTAADVRAEPTPAHVTRSAESSEALADVSRAHILRVLEATNWVVGGPKGAAARLSMKRSTLNYRMKKLGITRKGLGQARSRGEREGWAAP